MARIFDPSLFAFNPYAVPFWLIGLIVLGQGIIVIFRNYRSLVNITFFFIALSVSVWLIGNGINLNIVDNPQVAFIWCKIFWTGVIFISPSVYSFVVTILNLPDKKMRILIVFLVFAPFAIALHLNLVIKGVWRMPWGYFPLANFLEIPFLLLFFFMMVYIFLMLHFHLENPALPLLKRKQVRIIYLGLLLAYLGALDYLPNFRIYYYSLGYIPLFIWVSMVAYAVLRYELFEITPEIAVTTIISTMADILLVTDTNGVIVIANPAASATLGVPVEKILGRSLSDFLPNANELLAQANSPALKGKALALDKETYITADAEKNVSVSISAAVLRDALGQFGGIVIICHNIEKLKEYVSVISDRTKQLLDKSIELETKNVELEKVRKSLEEKVHERTEELEKERTTLEQKVKERTYELQERLKELQLFHDATVGRELKMIELEKEIESLKRRLREREGGSAA
jgi:PAS domain S-box-containing protein